MSGELDCGSELVRKTNQLYQKGWWVGPKNYVRTKKDVFPLQNQTKSMGRHSQENGIPNRKMYIRICT